MSRKYYNHKLQTNPWHHEEEPHNNHKTPDRQTKQSNQRSGSVVECLTQVREAAGSSLTSVTALVLVQPRKTRPCLTERLLMRRKESNQSNQLSLPHQDDCKTRMKIK